MTFQKTLLRYEPEDKNILPAIKGINEDFGYVSKEAIGKIARYFNISESRVFSVVSFYDEINLEKPSRVVIEICDGTNCQTKGSDKIIRDLEKILKIKEDIFSAKLSLNRMSCVGRCLEGPVAKVNGIIYTRVNANKIIEIIENKLGY